MCFSSDSCPFERHLANDLPISAWAFFVISAATTFLCFVFFVLAILETDENMLFEYGFSLVDMRASFTIGSAYFVAGAYPSPTDSRFESKNTNITTEL